jgi:hypothetical protein
MISKLLDSLAAPAESMVTGVLDELAKKHGSLELTFRSVQDIQTHGDVTNESLKIAMLERITSILAGVKDCDKTLRSREPASTPPAETINTGTPISVNH